MKKILSLAFVIAMIAMGCTKNDSQPVSAIRNSKSSPTRYGISLPVPECGHWDGWSDCVGADAGCICPVIITPHSIAALNQAVSSGPTAIASFFSNSDNIDSTFYYLNSSDSIASVLLSELTSGNYYITLTSSPTRTNINYYQVIKSGSSTGPSYVMIDSL